MRYALADATRSPGAAAPAAAPYDEMMGPSGEVRPHYAALARRVASLSDEDLAERQRLLERFFLLQGITFTVYGAESSTERIIPTDLLPRIIPAAEWATIEAGLPWTGLVKLTDLKWWVVVIAVKVMRPCGQIRGLHGPSQLPAAPGLQPGKSRQRNARSPVATVSSR